MQSSRPCVRSRSLVHMPSPYIVLSERSRALTTEAKKGGLKHHANQRYHYRLGSLDNAQVCFLGFFLQSVPKGFNG